MTRAAAGSTRTPVRNVPPGVAVLGLGASGDAAARLALEKYGSVYVSDLSDDGGTRRRARALEALGADVHLGGHDLGRIAGAGVVVTSPGIPGNAPVLRRLRARGVRWISEPEFAARFRTGALIGVTGTNGKTTTSVLIGHLLGAAGIDAAVGGNVGGGIAPPASTLALRSPRAAWWVLELSSFQLAGIERLSPEIGVLTNLSEDHLDRYGEVARYFADKKRLFHNATAASRWVVNGEDAEALALAGDAVGELHLFAGKPGDAEPLPARARLSAFVRDGVLTLRAGEARGTDASDEPLVPRDKLRLLGQHNVMNALAAALAARFAGAAPAGLRRGLASFAPLPHRLEPITERSGVLWVNDSKATNVTATLSALASIGRPVVLILGGKDKGEDPLPLVPALRSVAARAVVLYGETAGRWARELSRPLSRGAGSGAGRIPVVVAVGLDDAVAVARRHALPGDALLLSPACPSFDLFQSYEERGARFSGLAREDAR